MGPALFGPGAGLGGLATAGWRRRACAGTGRAGRLGDLPPGAEGSQGGRRDARQRGQLGARLERAEIGIRLWSGSFWEAIERQAERSTEYYVNCLSNWGRKLP